MNVWLELELKQLISSNETHGIFYKFKKNTEENKWKTCNKVKKSWDRKFLLNTCNFSFEEDWKLLGYHTKPEQNKNCENANEKAPCKIKISKVI